MFTISYYPLDQISALKADWLQLEKGGEMTYFQSYDWNEMLTRFVPQDNILRENRLIKVCDEERCVLIAPLLIIKHSYLLLNKQGFTFIASNDWSDYNNLIYDEFDSKAVDFLFDQLRQKYGIRDFRLDNIPEHSSFYHYIQEKFHPSADIHSTCVKLSLPLRSEDYPKMLSKGSRQNIRTAYNRMKKDGVAYHVVLDDRTADIGQCLALRSRRREAKRKERKDSLLKRLKTRLTYKVLLYRLHDYNPLQDGRDTHVASLYEGDALRAYFCYGIDMTHQTVVVMMAGTDIDFARYSPGIITMYELIDQLINEGSIKYLDFTRGTERYKYDLGGEEHYIHNVRFAISEKHRSV